MNDLISRQAAIRKYQEVCNGIKCGECPFLIKVNTEKGSHLITDCKLEAFLHNLPSAERHGRWEKVDDNPYEYVAVCSVCRNEVKQPTCMLKPIYSYCPICGARMVNEDA